MRVFTFRRCVLRRRVIVNLKTEKAISGVVTRKSGPLLEIRDSELLEGGRQPVKIDGAIIVERGNVDFLQVLGG